MKDETLTVRKLLRQLLKRPLCRFPSPGQSLDAPPSKGVYLIYSPRGRLLHVGRTPKAKRGLAQRLSNHLNSASSFVNLYLDGDGGRLRRGYTYKCLVVGNPRHRALLEALAIGALCPAHVGLG